MKILHHPCTSTGAGCYQIREITFSSDSPMAVLCLSAGTAQIWCLGEHSSLLGTVHTLTHSPRMRCTASLPRARLLQARITHAPCRARDLAVSKPRIKHCPGQKQIPAAAQSCRITWKHEPHISVQLGYLQSGDPTVTSTQLSRAHMKKQRHLNLVRSFRQQLYIFYAKEVWHLQKTDSTSLPISVLTFLEE